MDYRVGEVTRSEDELRHSTTVPASAAAAFERFARGLQVWWPREYTWSGEVLERIEIVPEEGGACYEVGPFGFRCDWGRVLAWEPPGRLVLAWHIAPDRTPEPDPERASEVELCFVEEGEDRTRVELTHRKFHRHGDGGEGYREAMESPGGWEYILNRYAASLSG